MSIKLSTSKKDFLFTIINDYWRGKIAMFKLTKFMIILILTSSIVVFYPIASNTLIFAQNKQGIVISIANSTFAPLTNTDANQLKLNIKYTIQDDSLKNQKINAVMKVFAPNGTLIKTTSFPNGFIAKSSGGTEAIKTTFKDKSLKSIVANLTITDLAKSKPLSNIVKVNVPLKDIPTVSSLLGGRPSFQNKS